MSDIISQTLTPPTSTPRRRGPAARRHLTIDGKEWKPRDEVSDNAGISHRTGARVFKNRVRYIAGVAYVPEQDALRDLVSPPARTHAPSPEPQHRRPVRKRVCALSCPKPRGRPAP